MTEKILIEIPADLADTLAERRDRLPEILQLGLRQLKVQEALTFYEEGIVTLARAAELAGIPLQDMIREARAKGIRPRWNEKMVEEELLWGSS